MIMECVNPECGTRTTKHQADSRNYRTGACAKCGWGLTEVVEGLPNTIAAKLDAIFRDEYIPIQTRTELEKMIVRYADVSKFNGKQEAHAHIKKDLSNYGVTEADYVMGLYEDLLLEEASKDGR